MERKNGNWTIKKTEKKFANDFFKVHEDKVIQPDGKNGKYATVEFVPGVSVLPIDEKDFVYLTKQFRYSAGGETLEVVAGAVEDETPMRAAKRELKEELGIRRKNLPKLGKFNSTTRLSKVSQLNTSPAISLSARPTVTIQKK